MARDEDDEPVKLGQARLVRETDMAICVKLKIKSGWGQDRWFPKSVVHDDSEVWGIADETGPDTTQEGELIVKRRFAEREGLT